MPALDQAPQQFRPPIAVNDGRAFVMKHVMHLPQDQCNMLLGWQLPLVTGYAPPIDWNSRYDVQRDAYNQECLL